MQMTEIGSKMTSPAAIDIDNKLVPVVCLKVVVCCMISVVLFLKKRSDVRVQEEEKNVEHKAFSDAFIVDLERD